MIQSIQSAPSEELLPQIADLLAKARLSTTILSMNNCVHGGNNRTYKIVTPDGAFVVKKYFRQSADTRDRLAAEFSFLCYAKKVATDAVPTPYSQDAKASLALYEFIDGKPLRSGDITEKEIAQAAQFFCALNEAGKRAAATHLPIASEACFTIKEHLDLVSARIDGLQQIQANDPEDSAAEQLVHELSAYWQTLLNEIKQAAHVDGIDAQKPLGDDERCISPSDFGFHNALKMTDGSIRFLDFEYAGWDDPAKMVGDFFSQLAVPVAADYFDGFVRQVMTPFSQPVKLLRRAHLLRAVYQVKWCCIALNVFIPVNLARRQFANPELNVGELKRAQLIKAEKLLQNLVEFGGI